jgi:hypothetical protein
MLGAFDLADTVTAAQLHAAAAGFSEKTENRGRAELTRDGVLVRGKRGMEGEVTYTIDREQLAPVATTLGRRSFSTTRQPWRRTSTNVAATEEYADDYGDDDADDYDDAGNAWGWIAAIGISVCGLATIVFVRRRFGAFPIASTRRMMPAPFTNSAAPAPLARKTPARRAARTDPIVAPYPGDDAIFGPDAAIDETSDSIPPIRLNRYRGFSVFPDLWDFGAGSDA